MEERIKKLEELIAEHEKRLLVLEGTANVNAGVTSVSKEKQPTVTFDGNDRPRFNVILPSSSRQETQRTAIILLLHAKKESEAEMSTKRVSSFLYRGGVDVTRIQDAIEWLKDQKPALIASKPGKRTVILTNHGEEETNKLAKQLKWR